jgi:glycosyltransferase involved in cell wall biosynthesis
VHLLGRVDDDERELLFRGVDLFVQPNVPVRGNMEGFGLAPVEAALRGTPVVAARLEGIPEAVVDGETGVLVAPADADAWVSTVTSLLADGAALARRGREFQRRAAELHGPARMKAHLAEAIDG